MKIPTLKIPEPGFLRIGYVNDENGYALLFLKGKEYMEPGTTHEVGIEDIVSPLLAMRIFNSEQARNIGKSIIDMANRIEAEEKEDKNGNEDAGSGSES